MKRATIFIVTHIHSEYPDDAGYVPIQAGKGISSTKLNILGDDTGDNITDLNRSFCELTALYWIWKNRSDENVGLSHYRRFFASKREKVQLGPWGIASSYDFDDLDGNIDLIVAQPTAFYVKDTRPCGQT